MTRVPDRRQWRARTVAPLLASAGLSLVGGGCARPSHPPASPWFALRFERLANPAGLHAAQPNLSVGPDGRLRLSWLQRETAGGHALRFSTLADSGWTAAKTVARGDDWFVNWADFPSLVALADGSLAAHWLAVSGQEKYAYGIRLAFSRDGGAHWSAPIVVHDDDTPTEHGFVSLLPWGASAVMAVWLDGRNYAPWPGAGGRVSPPTDEMTLRFATFESDGRLVEAGELDERVCDCCQTAAIALPAGAVVAYRDRSSDEVRDISIVSGGPQGWSRPRPLHVDGWSLRGCPVNGPALAADGTRVAAAWFTGAHDTVAVNVAFSSDAGSTFGPPIRVDDGATLGRVGVVQLPGGTAVVSWMRPEADGLASVCVREIAPSGERGPPLVVDVSRADRASGFPRLARAGDRLVIAWTQAGDTSRVLTSSARLSTSP